MAEIKNKIITMESLAMVHAYNKDTYMPKINNVLVLVDLDDVSKQYNLNDFISFILEIVDFNNETKQIMFTNKTVDSVTFDTKSQASLFDENGDMLLYELYFYLNNDKYMVEPMLTKITLLTGEKTSSSFSYSKLYGIKVV